MASMDPEQKIKFLLCVLKNTEGTPNMQAVAVDRGDKRDNVSYHFKAIAKASGQYIVERLRVVAVDEAAPPTPPTPTGSKKKTNTAKKVEKASTLDGEKTVEPTTPRSGDSVTPKVEEPVTPNSAEAEEAKSRVDDEEEAAPTTPKTPNPTASKKRGRAKKDANDGDDILKTAAKKPRKTKKQKEAEEKAKEVEEAMKDDNDEEVADDIKAKEEEDDVCTV